LNIEWPFGGLSDLRAKGDQDKGTTPEAVNVRGWDPNTGRLRGGVREGTEKVNANALASSIRQIEQVSYAPPLFTYAQYAQGSQVEEWKVKTPLTSDCRGVRLDAADNVYVLDGRAGVAKYNAEGKLVWKFVLPVKSQEHVCRAFAVDEEGAVYVGVSEGYPMVDAKLWKYRVRDAGESVPNKEWEVALDGYVEQVQLRQGYLYAAMNNTSTGSSRIDVYRLIDTAVPEIAWSRSQVPHPINDLSVRTKDGAIATAHEANTTRAYNKLSPDTQKIAVDWTPDRLDSWDVRKWAGFDASDIDGDGSMNSAYANGDALTLWTDFTGNERNFYSYEAAGLTAPTSCTAPTLNKSKKFGGQDSVVFSNPTLGHLNPHNAMVTLPNGQTTSTASETQRTAIPCYDGAQAVTFIVCRTGDFTNARPVMSQVYSGTNYRAFVLNSTTASGTGFATSSGFASMHQSLGGAGTSGPYAAYETSTGFAVFAIFINNAASATTTGLCSVNGNDCTFETYTGRALTATDRTQLGKWTTVSTGSTSTTLGVAPFDGEIAYMLTLRDYNSGANVITTTEFDKMEGYLHWRFGIAHKLPASHTYRNAPPTVEGLPAATTTSPYLYLTDTEQMLVKWDPNTAKTRWVVKDSATSTDTGLGGVGYGCVWPDNGDDSFIFSMGPQGTSTAATSTAATRLTRESVVRRIKDNGDTATLTGTGTWESPWGVGATSTVAAIPTYHFPRMAVSGATPNVNTYEPNSTYQFYGNALVYVPVHTSTTTSTAPAVFSYLQSGNNAGSGTSTAPDRRYTLATGSRAYACAVERETPEYQPGLLSGLPDEKIIVGGPKEGVSDEAVTQIRAVGPTRVAPDNRTVYTLAAMSNSLLRVSGVSTASPSSYSTIASTGYVSTCVLGSRIYGTDGETYFTIDPRASDGFGRILKPNASGAYPKKCRLMWAWNQRLCMGRGVDPHLVFMAAIGNPQDANTLPAERSGYEAVTIPLDAPLTTAIPFTDDLLLLGTASGVYRQTGDPAQGGRLDRIADLYGMPFGEPWCKDEEGAVYFFMSHGGVTRMSPGGKIESVTDAKIKRRFEAIDLTEFNVRLVWNDAARGLHVFVCPADFTGTAPTTHYFFEAETGAWYEDSLNHVVTSARSIDKDGTGNRAVWIGCQDGYIRRFTQDADTDDGSAIHSKVFLGWYATEGQTRFSRPQVTLAPNIGGARMGFYVSDDANEIGNAVAEEVLVPGLNGTLPMVARGSHVGIMLSGTGRWAFESGAVQASPLGIRRRLMS